MDMSRRTFGLAAAALTLPAPVWAATPGKTTLEFMSSPLGDYLHVLLVRADKPALPVFRPDGFPAAPEPGILASIPERVARQQLTAYDDVEPLIRAHVSRGLEAGEAASAMAELAPSFEYLRLGKPFYEAFEAYWRENVQALSQAQISEWRLQNEQHGLLDRLATLHRLPGLKVDALPVVAMPFHASGSGTVDPPGVYSSLSRRPNLGWFLGHEATHLIWSGATGTEWEAHPLASRARALAEPRSIDLEEIACLLMQVALPQSCGMIPADYRISAAFPDGGMKRLLGSLEENLTIYQTDAVRWPTLIDYVLETSLTALA
ncbi:hypothetical protein ACIQC9_03315 [Brevundimonas sp. NPDC092305]|uniref:hypothetical protein n=1 Tax=Brevundimonas sp. NPDC092305 TaxID=3363957 RepID=UPI0038270597